MDYLVKLQITQEDNLDFNNFAYKTHPIIDGKNIGWLWHFL